MFTAARKYKKTLQSLALVGALAFTLSTLPGLEDASETTSASRSEVVESSDSDCSGLGRRDYDFCTLNGTGDLKDITAEVKLRKVEDQVRDDKDPERFKPTKEFEVEMRTLCKSLDGDCTEKTSVIRVPLAEHRQLVAKARELFRSDAKVIVDAKAANAKRRQEEFDCKVDANGKPVKDLIACRIVQLNRVRNDEEKGAAYFQVHVLPEVKKLLSSTNPLQQKRGMDILKEYAAAELSNDSINQAIETHRQFGIYNSQYVQDRQALSMMARMNPMQAQQAYALADYHRAAAEHYFANRGLELPSGSWLQNDASTFRQIVSDHYAMTMNQYQIGNQTNQMLMNNLAGNGWNQQTQQGVVAANQNMFNGQPMTPQQQQLLTQQQLQQNQMQQQQVQTFNGLPVPPQGQRTAVNNINPRTGQPMPQSAQQAVRSLNPRANVRAPLR